MSLPALRRRGGRTTAGPGRDPTGARHADDLRLVVPAVAAWLSVGLLIGVVDGAPALPVVVAVAAAVSASLLLLLARARGALVALALVGVSLGAGAVGLHAEPREVEALIQAADERGAIEARVEVTETPAVGDRHLAVSIVAVRAVDGSWTPVAVPAVAFGRAERDPGERSDARVRIGVMLEGRVRVERAVPGDRAAFLLFADGKLSERAAAAPVVGGADALRAAFTTLASSLPGDGGTLLPGLAIGDTSRLDPTLDAAMTAASLGHLTAVSGANCAVVVGLVLAAARACGAPRGVRSAAAVVVLGGFVVLVTPQPSVLRASVMCAAVLLAGWSGRSSRGVPVLALAVLVLVLADPWIAREYGFVLSVLATAALLVLAPPLAERLARVVPRGVALVLAVPISAQLVCQPVVVLLEPSVAVYSVPANLLAGPAAPLATVCGLLACVLHPLVPPIATLLASVAWAPSAWIAAVARFFATAPGSQLPWFEGWVGVGVLTAITLAAGVVVFARGRSRRVAGVALVLVTALAIGSLVGDPLVRRMRLPGDWQYGACDVGQGDATLIRDGPAVAVVDVGEDPDRVARCLDTLGIARVSLLVLTHFDRDHVAGADALIGRVDRVLAGPPDTAEDVALLDRFASAGARVDPVVRGEEGTLGRLHWRVLWPSPRRAVEPGNAASVVLHVGPGRACPSCLSALLLGDLGEEEQDGLLRLGAVPAVDVVKVAHHGSRDQSPALYDAASARLALIGVGADNGYGHPTEELLALLAGDATAITRTDRDGLVLVSPGHSGIAVWRERDGASP
ncbi:competence protein ComEC [Diaminobutyricimonas aerilata]|uniref:Competence protein ComEC n=1 Tax=Diaminobutyricimonas aerilata TaxID=1162967 RepID=A0A2M9CJE1_9MICO|nr:ComEC/Rec2 family competence protein [Diaminobutyricimonas aerilata]PJJ72004.1 competence protein ComEC [Diaminobutyricimonas aerilata]